MLLPNPPFFLSVTCWSPKLAIVHREEHACSVCVYVCVHTLHAHLGVRLSVDMYTLARVYSNGPSSHLQAIRSCEHFGERTDLTEHRTFWEREHLAGTTVFFLALRIALWALAAISLPCTDATRSTSLSGLMEDRRQGGLKYLLHELKRFAIWTLASFYNNFHLKPAQYIFNEFFYKTFNSPQFISSGKWLSSLKWWDGGCLYLP